MRFLICAGLAFFMSGCATTPKIPPLQDAAARAVRDDPQNPDRWVEYGRACLFAGNSPAAEMAFRRALELDPQCVPAYHHLGLVLADAHRYGEAEWAYAQALQIRETDSGLWTAYGYCLAAAGNEGKALDAFRRAVAADTDRVAVVSARLGAAGVLSRQGNDGAARSEYEYEEALRLDPQVAEMLAEQRAMQHTAGDRR